MNNERISPEEAARILAEKEHPSAKQEVQATIQPEIKPAAPIIQKEERSIYVTEDGRYQDPGASQIHSAADDLWKNLPLENLPSGGLFYPESWEITIKPAQVMEIRHWSTMDESDFLNIDDRMNFIIEKCLRIRDHKTNSFIDWKNIKELDRFYILFRIHELTFPNGENKITLKFTCTSKSCQSKTEGGFSKRIQLNSAMLNIFQIPEELLKFYNPEERALIINSHKTNKTYKFVPPSIGVGQRLKNYANNKREDGRSIDQAFMRVAPFILTEYRTLTDDIIDNERNTSIMWNKNEVLFFAWVADEMEKGIQLTATYNCQDCGEAIVMPLFFREGISIKSLFAISNPLDGII